MSEPPPPANPPADPPPPANPPAPEPPKSGSGEESWRAPFEALSSTVASLAEAITKLAPQDEAPVKRPWTHIGSRPKNER